MALGAGAVSQPGRCGSGAASGCWELAQSTSRAVTVTAHPGCVVQPSLAGTESFPGARVWVSLSSHRRPPPGRLGFGGGASLVPPARAKPAEQVGAGTAPLSPSRDIQPCTSPPSWGAGQRCPQQVPASSPGQARSPEWAGGDREGLLGASCPHRSPGWEQAASLGVNWGRIGQQCKFPFRKWMSFPVYLGFSSISVSRLCAPSVLPHASVAPGP